MKIAFLTSGGIAPCLSSSIAYLIKTYMDIGREFELIGYCHGYKGLLKGDSIEFNDKVKKNPLILKEFGGTPIGNSRVKLTNLSDCIDKDFSQYFS